MRRKTRYNEKSSYIMYDWQGNLSAAPGVYKIGNTRYRHDSIKRRGDGVRQRHPGPSRGITLTIEDGEFVFLVGPSGVRQVHHHQAADRRGGTLRRTHYDQRFFRQQHLRKADPLMRRTLGVIFQDFRLIEKKTVYDNLAFVMRAVGASPKEIRKRIPYVLELVGLGKKADSYPTELSGGEQQRVAIARALVNNPNTIIADEPTGNLDPERSLELMSLLVKINELGTTVVVVTHEKDLVDRFGKRVVTIDSGHVVNDSVGGYVGGHIHG